MVDRVPVALAVAEDRPLDKARGGQKANSAWVKLFRGLAL